MINEEISKKLRASYYFMSALLGRFKNVEMYFPGGCNIGKRPIDQTLKGFKALGATIDEVENKYNIYADELNGSVIDLDILFALTSGGIILYISFEVPIIAAPSSVLYHHPPNNKIE